MNESCHTYEWVMSHVWMRQGTHTKESWRTYEWVMAHIRMSHVTRICMTRSHSQQSSARESSTLQHHTPPRRLFFHTWMSHVTHMNESCHTNKGVMSHIWMSRVTRICVTRSHSHQSLAREGNTLQHHTPFRRCVLLIYMCVSPISMCVSLIDMCGTTHWYVCITYSYVCINHLYVCINHLYLCMTHLCHLLTSRWRERAIHSSTTHHPGGSSFTYKWVKSHIWMSHVTQIKE